MSLTIKSVFDKEFAPYGNVIVNYDIDLLLKKMVSDTPAPADAVVYVPSDSNLEDTPAMKEISNNIYGGMPIQIGYCNGTNTKLNCLEYHKDSEIDIAAEDCILLLGRQQDCMGSMYDTSKVEAFLCPAGTGVELYATTLHYAPCSAKLGDHFRVVIVLPKGTNYDKPDIEIKNDEDAKLFASNKWLIAHPEADEAKNGAVIGITGDNIDISALI